MDSSLHGLLLQQSAFRSVSVLFRDFVFLSSLRISCVYTSTPSLWLIRSGLPFSAHAVPLPLKQRVSHFAFSLQPFLFFHFSVFCDCCCCL